MRPEMVVIYRAPTGLEAHVVRSVLEQHEIEAEVRNEMLSSLAGAAMPAGNIVEVWIPVAAVEAAQQILSALKAPSREAGRLSLSEPDSAAGALSEVNASSKDLHSGRCPSCGEDVPTNLGECWNCQTDLMSVPP